MKPRIMFAQLPGWMWIVEMTDSERWEDSQAADRPAGQLDTCGSAWWCWSDWRLVLTPDIVINWTLNNKQFLSDLRSPPRPTSSYNLLSSRYFTAKSANLLQAGQEGIMLSSGDRERLSAAEPLPTWQTRWRQRPTGCLYFWDHHVQAGSHLSIKLS